MSGVWKEGATPTEAACGYCLSVGASVGGGDAGSAGGKAPLSSAAPVQSPAQIFVPLTVPTSLYIGSQADMPRRPAHVGFTPESGLRADIAPCPKSADSVEKVFLR